MLSAALLPLPPAGGPRIDPATPAVVIVGAGPVGLRVASELAARDPTSPIVVMGDEAWAPYNRVKLSSVLAKGGDPDSAMRSADAISGESIELRLGCAVRAIDRGRREVVDERSRVQRYRALVLATGSRPHLPNIPGIGLDGVFTFRDMNDAQRLCARRLRSRCTVVIGGGLLGLEAAHAMRRFHTRVVVLEHADQLMPRQLDPAAAALLLAQVLGRGIEVRLGARVEAIRGAQRVETLALRGAPAIECDSVIVATGIAPRIELARAAGVHVGRGIKVDDRLRTSDPAIFAVGDCAEHRGTVYGLLGPGLNQAAVAAHVLAGGEARYHGTLAATRLKIAGLPVFSMGEVIDAPRDARSLTHRDAYGYRKLVVDRGRLVGAVAVGEWGALGRVQEAVCARRALHPWSRLRFRWTGSPWPQADSADVTAWPASTIVCNCTGVTRGQLGAAFAAGCASVEALAARTSASTVCGSCRPLLAQLCGAGSLPPAAASRWLRALGIGASALAALLAGLPPVLWPRTADLAWRWDQLWRDATHKQASGYALLALMATLAVLSLRKRLPRLRLGDYGLWRAMHAGFGVSALLALVVHTGGKLGHNLNFALASCVLGLALAGGAASFLATEGGRAAPATRGLLERAQWLHILLLWPLPVLLAAHVLKSYYF